MRFFFQFEPNQQGGRRQANKSPTDRSVNQNQQRNMNERTSNQGPHDFLQATGSSLNSNEVVAIKTLQNFFGF